MSDSFASKEEAARVFDRLRQHPSNKLCFDCANRNPTWTSVPFGVLLCMECSSVHRNLGVHISFVKSSNLDAWQRIQLRNFKFGGNQAAEAFFRKNGGSQYLNDSVDAEAKYESSVAKKYKDYLSKKSAKDAEKHPDIVTLDDLNEESESNESNNNSDSDFFSNWSKPITNTPSPLGSKPTTPNASTDDLGKPVVKKPVTTRTVRRSNLSNAGKSILSSKTTSGPRSSRLQSKRINKDEEIDFDAIEKQAQLEAEETKKLGYKVEKEDDFVDAPVSKPMERASTSNSLSLGSGPKKEKLAPAPIENTTQQFQKLGFGMINGSNTVPSQQKKYKEVKYTGEVSNKFGSQKAISSDEYFGRGRFDENSQNEAKEKLKNFSNAQSISSSSYFGEEEQNEANRGRSESFNLENTAREFASKFSGNANQDLDVLKDALEDGATKVGQYLRDFLR